MGRRKRVIFIPGWINFEDELGVVDYARKAGWHLLSVSQHGGQLRGIEGMPVDGVITLLVQKSYHARYVREARVPVVDMWNELTSIRVPRVLLDNAAIARMGADHLMDQGFRHLAFVKTRTTRAILEREGAFRSRVESRGRIYHQPTMVGQGRLAEGFDAVVNELASQLTQLPKPLGIMIHYDGVLSHIVAACGLANLRIPDDIAIVGVGNSPTLVETGELPLSSVETNRRQQAYEAAALLDRLMYGEPSPPDPILVPPTRVIIRASSDILAVEDEFVRSAVSFMRQHYSDESVNVDAVTRATGISRRLLYDVFNQHLQQGVSRVLTGIRVEQAKKLLIETDMKVYAVALDCGFAGPEQLIRSFSRLVGISPGAFRQQSRNYPALASRSR